MCKLIAPRGSKNNNGLVKNVMKIAARARFGLLDPHRSPALPQEFVESFPTSAA